jgi:hypothetical protein
MDEAYSYVKVKSFNLLIFYQAATRVLTIVVVVRAIF